MKKDKTSGCLNLYCLKIYNLGSSKISKFHRNTRTKVVHKNVSQCCKEVNKKITKLLLNIKFTFQVMYNLMKKIVST